jgi:oligoendopeptidase F
MIRSEVENTLCTIESAEGSLQVERNRLLWRLYTEDSKTSLDSIDAKLAAVRNNDAVFTKIKYLIDNIENVDDPVLRRRIELNYSMHLRAAIDKNPEIARLQNKLEAEVEYLKDLPPNPKIELRYESDRNLRRRQIEFNAIAGEKKEHDLLKLMQLRNQRAREHGFANYADYALKTSEVDAVMLLKILNDIVVATEESYSKLVVEARNYLDVDNVELFDWPYFLQKKLCPPSNYFAKEQGLPRIHDVVRSFGVREEELGISFHLVDQMYAGGCCVCVDIPHDIRVMVRPGHGFDWYALLLHELGHGLLARYNQQCLILQKESITFDETIATLFETIAHDRQFLSGSIGMPESEINQFEADYQKRQLYELRRLISSFMFEYEAYLNLDQDLRQLADKVNEKYRHIPGSRSALWADDSFRYADPMYIHNYVLAWVITEQMLECLRGRFGGFVGSTDAFDHLRDYCFAPGGSISWQDKVKNCIGQEIDANILIEKLNKTYQ